MRRGRRQRAHRRHALGPVQEREPFFCFELNWLDLGQPQRVGARHSFAAIKRFTFADDRERQMGQRSEVTACAERSFFGDDGMNSQSVSCKRGGRPDLIEEMPRVAGRVCPATSEHGGAREGGIVEQIPDVPREVFSRA